MKKKIALMALLFASAHVMPEVAASSGAPAENSAAQPPKPQLNDATAQAFIQYLKNEMDFSKLTDNLFNLGKANITKEEFRSSLQILVNEKNFNKENGKLKQLIESDPLFKEIKEDSIKLIDKIDSMKVFYMRMTAFLSMLFTSSNSDATKPDMAHFARGARIMLGFDPIKWNNGITEIETNIAKLLSLHKNNIEKPNDASIEEALENEEKQVAEKIRILEEKFYFRNNDFKQIKEVLRQYMQRLQNNTPSSLNKTMRTAVKFYISNFRGDVEFPDADADENKKTGVTIEQLKTFKKTLGDNYSDLYDLLEEIREDLSDQL
jgi:hypothetical protein